MTDCRAILYAPSIRKDNVIAPGAFTSELLYLGQHLFNRGLSVSLLDAYADPKQEHALVELVGQNKPECLIVSLWKNESLLDGELNRIFSIVGLAKRASANTRVICIGSVAASIARELIVMFPEIDGIVTQKESLGPGFHSESSVDWLGVVRSYFSTMNRLTQEYLQCINPGYDNNSIVSLYSSRGCRKACSFCSYNKHLSKYQVRSMSDLSNDIVIMQRCFGVSRFALADNNFGDSAEQNLLRINEFLNSMKDQASQHFQLSLNISADGLSREVIDGLSRMNVKGILIGLESLDSNVLRTIYRKQLNLDHLKEMMDYLEKVGITPIVSYILFQPWLTYEGLCSQLEAIRGFGRHRLVHFLAKSVLQVVPGTIIETRLAAENLLIKNGIECSFRFRDTRVESIYLELSRFFRQHYSQFNYSSDGLAQLKIHEWEYARHLLNFFRS